MVFEDPIFGAEDDEIEIEDDGKHLWSSILEKVQFNCRVNLPLRKAIVLLGDNNGGKTSLAARLQRNDDPKESKGLEFHYMDVKDESRDESTRLGMWILDGDAYHSNLLKFALTEENVADCMVLLVASMAEPWKIMDSLRQWSEILEKHMNRLRIAESDMEELKSSLVRDYQNYSPPSDDTANAALGQAAGASSSRSRRTVNPLHPPPSNDPEKVVLPLSENTFSKNFGVPVVVVITKSDSIHHVLEREMGYKDEHLDFIQMHVRRFCLEHGAGLFYLSVKEDRNCELLSRYIQHRIYGFPFSTAAYVVEKDSIFVPTGWDNNKKIKILTENILTMDPKLPYGDVITRPALPRKSGREQRDTEAVAEDEQVFLLRQQTAIQRAGPVGDVSGGSGVPNKEDSQLRAPGMTNTSSSGRSKPGMGTTGAPAAGSPGQEGILSQFFNSLLSKKPASAGGPGSVGPTGQPTQRGTLSRQGSKGGNEPQRRSTKPLPPRSPVSPQPRVSPEPGRLGSRPGSRSGSQPSSRPLSPASPLPPRSTPSPQPQADSASGRQSQSSVPESSPAPASPREPSNDSKAAEEVPQTPIEDKPVEDAPETPSEGKGAEVVPQTPNEEDKAAEEAPQTPNDGKAAEAVPQETSETPQSVINGSDGDAQVAAEAP